MRLKPASTIRTPPLLLGAALLFWGWQTQFVVISAVMAVVLEASRWIRLRWDATDEDFRRIWTLCTLLLLGAVVFAFTDSGGPARFGSLFDNSSPAALARASAVSARTASAMLRWLPLILFVFVAAQAFSNRSEIPVSTISLVVRRRIRRAQATGQPLPPARGMNASYPYFAVCLFAASVHEAEDSKYFWGLSLLLVWALWTRRVKRFNILVWSCAIGLALACGFFGQRGISRLGNYLQSLDPQWLARWLSHRNVDPTRSQTAIGRIGGLKTSKRIVIRVTPEKDMSPPTYLREATYRVYRASSWLEEADSDEFERIDELPANSRIWTIHPGTVPPWSVRIACYLEGVSRETDSRSGVLPLPLGTRRLENLNAFTMRMNHVGTVVADGPGLLIFDARYGPKLADAPFDPSESNTNLYRTFDPENRLSRERNVSTNPDLHVPERQREMLEEVISTWDLRRGTPEETVRAVRAFFAANFSYCTWQDQPLRRRRETQFNPLGHFLLETRSGHCEYFATATVLLLRELGIPARYAVGYFVHEPSNAGYVVRLRDAHAWCLVWDAAEGMWRDIDTTPASWLEAESGGRSAFQLLGDFWSWIKFQFSRIRSGDSNLRPYLLGSLIPALVLMVYQIFFRRRRRRTLSGGNAARIAWPGMDSEFYRVEKEIAARGHPRESDEPLSKWLHRVLADPVLARTEGPLRRLLQLHYRYRFDPRAIDSSEREELRRRAAEVSSQFKSRAGSP